jgi:hypothetical protein
MKPLAVVSHLSSSFPSLEFPSPTSADSHFPLQCSFSSAHFQRWSFRIAISLCDSVVRCYIFRDAIFRLCVENRTRALQGYRMSRCSGYRYGSADWLLGPE